MHQLSLSLLLVFLAHAACGADLASGEYAVTQSWSQERDFKRPYLVRVPGGKQKAWPVLVFLHGNGGHARGALRGFTNGRKRLSKKFILVFPEGYEESWNIVSERSKADDLGFIESIIREVSGFDNVQKDHFTIMGVSNGAALANQVAIETKLKSIRNYITAVSPLNRCQHDGKHFKAKGKDNTYTGIAQPLTGLRLLNISGVQDRLVPYRGGPSKAIPGKGGKLSFVDAEESIFLWAKHMGYQGEKLTKGRPLSDRIERFSYLDGSIVHYKVVDRGHNATGAISEAMLLDFLDASKAN